MNSKGRTEEGGTELLSPVGSFTSTSENWLRVEVGMLMPLETPASPSRIHPLGSTKIIEEQIAFHARDDEIMMMTMAVQNCLFVTIPFKGVLLKHLPVMVARNGKVFLHSHRVYVNPRA